MRFSLSVKLLAIMRDVFCHSTSLERAEILVRIVIALIEWQLLPNFSSAGKFHGVSSGSIAVAIEDPLTMLRHARYWC